MSDEQTPALAATPLHCADPRWKFLVCGGLAVSAFAAGNWQRLLLAAIILALLAATAGYRPRWLLRTLWPLRWLLLFTVLMHLCLSPGQTLLGLSWLSRDGLMHGLLISVQLALATLAAALLTAIATPSQTAGACCWLLLPLARFGFPVRRWQELVILVLNFVPVLREELRSTAVAGEGRWSVRMMAWEERLLPLFDRLVERADHLAVRLASGKETLFTNEPLPALTVRGAGNLMLVVGGSILVLGFVLAG